MASEHLSKRKIQPGNDASYKKSEKEVLKVVKKVLKQYPQLSLVTQGRYKIFPDYQRGCIKPEFTIMNNDTSKVMNFEVKKQKKRGNAEERVYKLFTPKFSKAMKKFFNVDYHPFKAIFCEQLAVMNRYTAKFDVYLEESDYFLWQDYKNKRVLENYIENVIKDYLL